MNNRSFNVTVPTKHNLATFLDENKDVCEQIQQYARENLPELSIKLMSEYIWYHYSKYSKRALAVEPSEGEKYENQKVREMLQEYGLKTICPLTIYHWLKKLGFVHELRKKGYCVDGQKKPSTVKYQHNFIKQYLTYERWMYQWIQMTQEESDVLKAKGLVMPNNGYQLRT